MTRWLDDWIIRWLDDLMIGWLNTWRRQFEIIWFWEGSKDSGSCRYRFLLIWGAVFNAFGRHFWYLGDLLGGIGASLSLSGVPGDPWELQGSIFMDFGSHFGGPWEVSFHVFFIINSMWILKSILVWILNIFLMVFWWCLQGCILHKLPSCLFKGVWGWFWIYLRASPPAAGPFPESIGDSTTRWYD